MVKLAVLAVALGVAACASMAHAGSLRNEGVVKDDRLLVNRGEDRDLRAGRVASLEDSEADEDRDLGGFASNRAVSRVPKAPPRPSGLGL
jgi:hypothetical protein